MSWKDCDCGMARIRAEIERCSTCEIAAHKDEQIAALTRELDEARRLHMGQAGRAAGWRARARYAREALERLIELVADDPEAKDTTTPLCVAVTVARAEVTAIEEAKRREADRSTPPLELAGEGEVLDRAHTVDVDLCTVHAVDMQPAPVDEHQVNKTRMLRFRLRQEEPLYICLTQ